MGSFHESPEDDNENEARHRAGASASLRPAGRSDPGCERESNEDRFLMVCREEVAGFFVFDGMGGQPAGEAAAQISSDVIKGAMGVYAGGDLTTFMTRAIEMAQEAILSRRDDPATEGMGTTVVGAVVGAHEVVVGAVGDSRAYHIQAGSVVQLTHDHTLVQQLVDAGQITPYDALVHPQSHILTRCLGSTLDFSIDCKRYTLQAGQGREVPEEWLLLCSDGLYSLVSEEELGAMVLNFSAEEATLKLVELARARGGFDNISVVIVPLLGRLADANGVAWSVEPEGEIAESSISRAEQEPSMPLMRWNRSGALGKLRRAGVVALLSALTVIGAVVWIALMMVKER